MNTDFYNRNMFYGANATTLRAAGLLRKNMTLAKLLLWKKLKDKNLFSPKFRRQHPIDIFIVDFYCHEYKLVIEIDGEVHNTEEANQYDLARTAVLNELGLKVIRFTNDQVIYKSEDVLSEILQAIAELTPL
jgi:very-short-patch-repair endonuclease